MTDTAQGPSDAQIIAKYIEYRDFIAAQQAALNEKLKPYQEAMTKFEAYMSAKLTTMAGDDDSKASIATAGGTAFRKRNTSIKVVDREEWMDFIFDGRREGFITTHVSKEAVKEYIDQFKAIPPGLDMTTTFTVQFNSPRQKKD